MARSKKVAEGRLSVLFLVIAVVVVITGGLCLSACRYTDILTEHIEDPISGTLDVTADPEYRENPDAPLDASRPASNPSTNKNKNNQENTAPTYSVTSTTEVKTDQRQQEERSDKQEEATEGSKKSSADGENATTTTTTTTSTTEASERTRGDGEESKKGKSKDSDPGDEGQGGDEGTGGKGGTGKVYNDGTYKNLPENVGSVAATGQYAVIVQMLAGKGGLAACDTTTLKAMKSTNAFEYKDDDAEGLDDIKIGWSGDGSKDNSVDVKAIIAAEPDAVLTDGSTTALNSSQTTALTKAGIDVVSVPRLGTTYTSDDDVVKAVRLVGTLLKKASTQYSANSMASKYVQLHDSVIESCTKANGGYSYKVVQGYSMPGIYQGTDVAGVSTKDLSDVRIYTAFVDDWTSKVKSDVTASRKFGTASMYLNGEALDMGDGVGISACCSSSSFVLMDYYLQVSGVVDNSFDTRRPESSSQGNSLPYVIIAGDAQDMMTIEFTRRTVPSALWFSITGAQDSSSWTIVGDEAFPALLVRNEDIAGKIVDSASKPNGLYNMGQNFKVWVVPQGLAGSWADGTVESFLLSSWAYDMFQEGGKLDACLDDLDNFCTTFYRASYKDVLENCHTVKTAKSYVKEDVEEKDAE